MFKIFWVQTMHEHPIQIILCWSPDIMKFMSMTCTRIIWLVSNQIIVLNGFYELIASNFEEIPEFQRPNNMNRPHCHFAHIFRLAQRISAEKSDLSTVLKMFWFIIEFKNCRVGNQNQTNMGKNFIKIHLSGCQLEWFILMNEFNFFFMVFKNKTFLNK